MIDDDNANNPMIPTQAVSGCPTQECEMYLLQYGQFGLNNDDSGRPFEQYIQVNNRETSTEVKYCIVVVVECGTRHCCSVLRKDAVIVADHEGVYC